MCVHMSQIEFEQLDLSDLHLEGQSLSAVAWLKQHSWPSPSNTTLAAAFDWKVLGMRIPEFCVT